MAEKRTFWPNAWPGQFLGEEKKSSRRREGTKARREFIVNHRWTPMDTDKGQDAPERGWQLTTDYSYPQHPALSTQHFFPYPRPGHFLGPKLYPLFSILYPLPGSRPPRRELPRKIGRESISIGGESRKIPRESASVSRESRKIPRESSSTSGEPRTTRRLASSIGGEPRTCPRARAKRDWESATIRPEAIRLDFFSSSRRAVIILAGDQGVGTSHFSGK